VSRGAQRRRRSNTVGSASPTSTPRCASRHCTAPGKCLHRERCSPQRRRCPADRDLRGAGRRRDQRQARASQGATCGMGPALERRPPGHRFCRDRPGTDPLAYGRDRLPNDRPQSERHRDCRMPVVPARRDSARYDGEDRAALHAEIASALNHHPARRTVDLGWPAQLAVADAVPVEPESTTGGPTRGAAVDARSRPGGLHRWR
jgi:hypothetical protein